MRTVEIHYIEFRDNDMAMNNDLYPNSGLFMVKLKDLGNSDLRFIDKSLKSNYCIMPESVFNDKIIIKESLEPEIKPKYDGDFILEFSRILLNRK